MLVSTSYKIVSNILLSKLSPYEVEIIGGHQCGFRHNRSTTDEIFFIHQILEKWGYSQTVRQLFTDMKKAYDSVRSPFKAEIAIAKLKSMNLQVMTKFGQK
jgi:hypothetical protein